MCLLHIFLVLLVNSIALLCAVKALGDNRIYIGQITVPNSLPYQVALLSVLPNRHELFCGGSLITTNFVLTAAHCLFEAKSITVFLGAHSIKGKVSNDVVVMKSKLFKYHENFVPSTMQNDVGVVELPKPVKLTRFIETVQLPKKSDQKNILIGEYGKVAGWGATTDASDSVNHVLKELRVRVVSANDCYGFRSSIRLENLCGIGESNGSACIGDSGSPLVLENTNTQIGIVSFGSKKGCTRGFAHVYTNVHSFLDWIQTNSDYYFEKKLNFIH